MAFKTTFHIDTPEELASQDSQQPTQEPGIGEQLTGGLVIGLNKDPFLHPLVDGIRQLGGFSDTALEDLEIRMQGRTAAQITETIGEYGPGLLLGVGAYSVGKIGGTKLIQAAAQAAAKRQGTLDFATAVAPKNLVGNQLFRVGAQAQSNKAFVQAGEKLALGKNVGHIPGPLVQGTPGIQRATEIATANMALGSFVGSQELARGKSPTEAIQAAGLAAVFGVAIDGTLTGVARLAFPKARSFLTGGESGLEKAFTQPSITISNQQGKKLGIAATLKEHPLTGAPEKISPKELITRKLAAEEGVMVETNQRLQDFLKTKSQAQSLIRNQTPVNAVKQAKQELRLVRKEQKIRQELETSGAHVRGLKSILENKGVNPYTSQSPIRGPIQAILDNLDPTGAGRFRYLLSSPESVFGDLGVVGNKFFTQLATSVRLMEATNRAHTFFGRELENKARLALGVGRKDWRQLKETGIGLEATEAWETGSSQGLRNYALSIGRSTKDAEDLVQAYVDFDAILYGTMIKRGNKVGGKPDLFQGDGSRTVNGRVPVNPDQGVVEYSTHSSHDIAYEELYRSMKAKGLPDDEIVNLLEKSTDHLGGGIDSIQGVGGGPLSRSGPLAFDRNTTGTLKSKIARGLPLNPNHFDAGIQALHSAEHRIATLPLVGKKGEILDTVTKAIEGEGFNSEKFRTITDVIVGRKYYNQSMQRAASMMTGLQVSSKLTLAVFANATQSINTITWVGMKPFYQGAIKAFNKSTRDELNHTLGVYHGASQAIARSADNQGIIAGPADRLAEWTLKYSGFDSVERFNRMLAGTTALSLIDDTIAKASTGKLRGNLLDRRRRMLGELGIDLDGTLNKILVRGDDYLKEEGGEFMRLRAAGAIAGAQKTQFFGGKTRNPQFWSSPVGRVAFQFKSFALGQSRFIRDAIWVEASHGNYGPLATILSLSPIAGEAVRDIKAIIKGKERTDDGVQRFVNDIAAVGGMGLFSDTIAAARWGRLGNFLFGPTIGDGMDLLESLAQANVQSVLSQGARLPAFQAGYFLLGISAYGVQEMSKYLEMVGETEEDGPQRTFTDIGQLKTQRIQQKRR